MSGGSRLAVASLMRLILPENCWELIGREVGVDSRWLRQQTFELLPECLGVVAGAADGVRPVHRELPLQQHLLMLEL